MAGSLKEQITGDITSSLKGGDKLRLSTLRLLSAAITNREKDVLHPLSDDEVRQVAGEEMKKRTQAIQAYEGAGRQELADKERAEREVLKGYAPEPLSDDAVDALVEEAIASTGATSMKEMGVVMSFVMAKAKGSVDGNVVQQKVRALLGA